MSALAWGLLVVLAPQQPVGTVELRLVGPLAGAPAAAELEAGSAPTELRLELAAGESRLLQAPVLLPDSPVVLPVAARLSGAPAESRVVPGRDRHPGLGSELPPALVARGLPPLVESRAPARPGALHAAWVLAALVVVVAARRRPWVAGALGLVAAAALLLRPPERSPAATVEVLEGARDGGPWLRLRGARGRLELGAPGPGWLRRLPASTPVRLALEAAGAEARWAAEAPGARLYFHEELAGGDPGPPELALAWVREAGGAWRAHGPWAAGSPRPPAVAGGEPPPGWLIAGLPPGEEALVGRLAGPGERWLRVVGALDAESSLRR